MTDEQFTETAAYRLLCREFEVPVAGDAAAHLDRADRERFFREFDRLKAELDPTTEFLDQFPTICGECHASVKHSDTKIVERERPLKPGQKLFQGMITHEQLRVCKTHEVVTNWPK